MLNRVLNQTHTGFWRFHAAGQSDRRERERLNGDLPAGTRPFFFFFESPSKQRITQRSFITDIKRRLRVKVRGSEPRRVLDSVVKGRCLACETMTNQP